MLLALLGGVIGLAIGHILDVRIARRRARMMAQAGRLLDRG